MATVGHLRKDQVASQIRSRLRPLFEKPEKFERRISQHFCGCRWNPRIEFLPPGPQNNSVANILEGRLSFLNRGSSVGWPPDWNGPDVPRLWLYNLHYFEYLWALDYEQAKELILAWIKNHPLRQGQVGWEPYPTSLRLMNLCGVFFSKHRAKTEADPSFLNRLWGSICLQVEWLSEHLETHLCGNHLFENAAALAVVGSCFSGSAAEHWLRLGSSILEKEIPEQILSDGMHFELSSMYHSRITYLLAMLYNTGCSQLSELARKPLIRTAEALTYLIHPDGGIALLNDSALAIYNNPQRLITYVRELLAENSETICEVKADPFALPKAGYYGFRDDTGTYIICDAAPIGPDYIPGHAHADIFSFELSMNGHRVIVDSGVYDYEQSSTRKYCRSTRAHNTVEIAGQDQCEMWAAFRVGRRGYPQDIQWLPSNDGFCLSGWHDGYRRLKGSPIHNREFHWSKSGRLAIRDRTTSSKSQNVVSRLHLHPNCSIEQKESKVVRVSYPQGNFRIIFSDKGELSIEDSYYCPKFGVMIPNKALAYASSGCTTEMQCQIEGF